MNLDVFTLTPRLLDRLHLSEVLNLLFYAFLHQKGDCFRRFQRSDTEGSSELGERRYPASEGGVWLLIRRGITCRFDAGYGTTALRVSHDDYWREIAYQPPV